MPTRAALRAEAMRRLGSFQTITVAVDPDVTDTAAQRKVITSDTYSIERTSPAYGQANLWVGRYNEGNKVRQGSYLAISKAILVPPTTSNYGLRLYGYGATATTLTNAPANAGTIQSALRGLSASLTSVTVSGTNPPYTITLPSASLTLELVRADATDTTGSVTQGLSSFEGTRPWSHGLPRGTTVEVTGKYPAHDEHGLVGMNTLLNQALARLWFPDLLQFVSNDSTNRQVTFPLTAYPWLKTRSQILRAYAPTRWRHTFSFTVPGVSWTASLDVGFGATITTASMTASASASAIQSAINTVLGTNGALGSATVTANGTTRTVTIIDSPFAAMALTASNSATVTTTHEWIEAYRFTDGWRLKFEGETLTIEWDYPIQRGYTWFLEVLRPADTWICPQADYQTVGTTFANSTTGLANDLDQCVVDVGEVVAVTHYLACRQLSLYGPSQESKYWRDEQARAAQIAAYIKTLDLPTSNEPGFRNSGLYAVHGADSKFYWTGGW